ncbi:mannose-1-phosphate guanylyltransferase [Spirochaetia bacterium]|nr:mannose-1-phosphate guanylyltransferase [Spirochaetia bacterium]
MRCLAGPPGTAYTNTMFDDCIIMAGGSGTRLWPASNSRRPKQFLSISPEKPGYSFFSAAVERALAVIDGDDGRVIIIAGKNHALHIIEACAAFSAGERKHLVLIPEPCARNTAPAIACGVIYSLRTAADTERTMLVLTSDHIIQPLDQFKADAARAANFAARKRLTVFGIPPKNPDTGFGYIETDAAFGVKSFREKPDRETAEKFLAAGRFYWNSGMFAFSSTFMRDEFHRHAPEVIDPFEKLQAPGEGAKGTDGGYRTERSLRILENWPGLEGAYGETKAISFDYAIAEKCENTAMIRANFNWIDVGSWDEYAQLLKDTQSEVYCSGSTGCFVDSDIPVALAGVEDLIVTVRSGRDGGPPSVLILKKGESRRLREIVEKIKEAGRAELL